MAINAGKVKTRILVADDEEVIRSLLRYNLERQGWEVIEASNGKEAMEKLDDEVTVALLDLKMPHTTGIEVLRHVRKSYPLIPVVMISAVGQVQDAVETIKLGAFDYISKPFEIEKVLTVIKRAVVLGNAQNAGQILRSAMGEIPAVRGFFGKSEVSRKLMEQLEVIAPLDSTVMITGENGTGKTLLARMIHKASKRSDGPFITVSCPSLPRDLLEAEMFGHEKGAFTGALARRIGRVEMADGGTLFLDEIGDLPLSLQPKLLNFLQDREFQRIGGHEILTSNVRIIAATNVDLKKRIAGADFREDLFFRLNVLPIEVDPLRHRLEDLTGLSEHILNSISSKRNIPGFRVSKAAFALLQAYSWPGNVRELENVMERSSAFCKNYIIEPLDLPKEILAVEKQSEDKPKEKVLTSWASTDINLAGKSLAAIEKTAILQTLKKYDGNKANAARILGISEKSIYNKLARYEKEATQLESNMNYEL